MREAKAKQPLQDTTSTVQNISASRIPPLKYLVPDKLAIYISFFLSQFGDDPQHENDFLLVRFRSCFDQLMKPNTEPLSDPAIPAAKALVQGYFARFHGDSRLLKDSMVTYGKALKFMHVKLGDRQRGSMYNAPQGECPNIAFGCLTLAFCEVCMSSGKNSSKS